MKFNKVFVSLAVLSATSVAALISCGGGASPAQVPGVYVYARTEGGETVYHDDEILTYTVENAENLKYGEQDVVVHIKPRLFFHLTEGYNPITWETEGDPVIPYVGLGSPTNRFSYELPRNVAWTYEREDVENADEKTESYKLTIKKQYFQKNIVVGYGYGKAGTEPNNYAIAISSDVYKENIFSFSQATVDEKIKIGGKPITEDAQDMHGFIDSNHYRLIQRSDFSVANEGMTLVYSPISYDHGFSSALMSFDAIPSVKDGKYTEISVVGINYDSSENPTKIDKVTRLSNYSETDPEFIVRKESSFSDNLSIFIKWNLLADIKTYQQKYDAICVGFDPHYSCDVSASASSAKIKNLNSGYGFGAGVKVTDKWEDDEEVDLSNKGFLPNYFAFRTESYYSYKYELIRGKSPDSNYMNANNCFGILSGVSEGGSETATFFATFTYDDFTTTSSWPSITINYTNRDGGTTPIYLNTKDVYESDSWSYITDLSSEGSYNDAKWMLVNIKDDTELHKPTNKFVLFPTYAARLDAFVTPTEWSLAKSVNITINEAK